VGKVESEAEEVMMRSDEVEAFSNSTGAHSARELAA
jgi:hypothetical protein